jgi:signal transduction histidine kinase
MLRRAGNHVPEGSPLRAELREVCEIAQTTLEHVRGLSMALHPSILDDAGLDEALEWYMSNVTRQLGLTVSFERSGRPVRVDKETGIHIYRILQEALSNVAHHAGTHEAAVRLRASDAGVELDVEDHGTGLDTTRERRGLGIVTMRERAALVGGTIEFKAPSGGGTLVRLHVPANAQGA